MIKNIFQEVVIVQILKEAPECYIQQCSHCGAVLKYSECDINVAGKDFYVDGKDGGIYDGWYNMPYDTFICPSCNYVKPAERKWLIDFSALYHK